TTSASGLSRWAAAVGSGTAASAFPPAAGALLALGRGLAEFLDPAHAVHVMAHGDVGAQDSGQLLLVKRIGDGRGHAGPDQHGEECRVEAVPVGQAKAEI